MLSKIRALKQQLSNSEQRVADVVLSAPDSVLNSSLATLAARASVSEPTVIRFCRSIAHQGFQDFKLQLAQELARQMHYAQQAIASTDDAGVLSSKVIDGTIATLVQLRQQLDSEAMDSVIGLLAAARRIEFYGSGGNAVVATDAQLKFARLGIATVAYGDAYLHHVAASLLKPEDVAVLLSNTGRSKDMIRSAELARATGASVIVLSASGSPLAHQASITLGIDVAEFTDDYAPIKARIPHMVIIDALAIGVALRLGTSVTEQLSQLPEVLSSKFL